MLLQRTHDDTVFNKTTSTTAHLMSFTWSLSTLQQDRDKMLFSKPLSIWCSHTAQDPRTTRSASVTERPCDAHVIETFAKPFKITQCHL